MSVPSIPSAHSVKAYKKRRVVDSDDDDLFSDDDKVVRSHQSVASVSVQSMSVPSIPSAHSVKAYKREESLTLMMIFSQMMSKFVRSH